MHCGSHSQESFGGRFLSGCEDGPNIARLARSISAFSGYSDSQFQLEVQSLGCYIASSEKEGTIRRARGSTTSHSVSMISRNDNPHSVIDARPCW